MYALLLLQLMDHRKQVTRLGIPFRPEHPYETHARLAGFNTTSSLQACPKTAFTPMRWLQLLHECVMLQQRVEHLDSPGQRFQLFKIARAMAVSLASPGLGNARNVANAAGLQNVRQRVCRLVSHFVGQCTGS